LKNLLKTSKDLRNKSHLLTFLAVDLKVATATQGLALNAIAFLYNKFMDKPMGDVRGYRPSLRQRKLPVLLSRTEVIRLASDVGAWCWDEGPERLLGPSLGLALRVCFAHAKLLQAILCFAIWLGQITHPCGAPSRASKTRCVLSNWGVLTNQILQTKKGPA